MWRDGEGSQLGKRRCVSRNQDQYGRYGEDDAARSGRVRANLGMNPRRRPPGCHYSFTLVWDLECLRNIQTLVGPVEKAKIPEDSNKLGKAASASTVLGRETA